MNRRNHDLGLNWERYDSDVNWRRHGLVVNWRTYGRSWSEFGEGMVMEIGVYILSTHKKSETRNY